LETRVLIKGEGPHAAANKKQKIITRGVGRTKENTVSRRDFQKDLANLKKERMSEDRGLRTSETGGGKGNISKLNTSWRKIKGVGGVPRGDNGNM